MNEKYKAWKANHPTAHKVIVGSGVAVVGYITLTTALAKKRVYTSAAAVNKVEKRNREANGLRDALSWEMYCERSMIEERNRNDLYAAQIAQAKGKK